MSKNIKDGFNDNLRRQKQENNVVRKIVAVIVSCLVIGLLVLGFSFYRYCQAGLQPLDSNNSELTQVEIPIGTSTKEIGSILQEDGVIKSGLMFSFFVKMNNLSDFQGGYYQMAPNMSLQEIANLLQQGGTAEPESLANAKITIPEGYSITQIAELIADNTKYSVEDFENLMKDQDFFNEMLATYPELFSSEKDNQDVRFFFEGYLFPATYNYYSDRSLKELVIPMIDKMNSVMINYYEQIDNNDMTVQQVLTLASLVEKEGVSSEDRRNIAQVFLNRIDEDMPLQSDISVIYALEEHKVNLSNEDTQVDSPYNLYINTGYGPGPFNSPSEEAINAVVNPIDNDYIYFLADIDTGKVYFAKTYEEHLELKAKYIDSKNE